MAISRQQQSLLFFTRGMGRGHAVPDSAIGRDLLKSRPDLALAFASYSVGAITLRQLGWDVIEMNLPEDNPLWDSVLSFNRLIQDRRPTLVVSHEEFAVIPVAKAWGIPSIFLTDWFAKSTLWNMQALRYADEVICMDQPGYYDEPDFLKGRIRYVGNVFREMAVESADRCRWRNRFDIPATSQVVLVVPGGADFHSEANAPMFDLVRLAFDALPSDNKRLVWIAGAVDLHNLRQRAVAWPNILIIGPQEDFTSALLAADVVITKGNRTPLFECEALGVPSISVSFGLNWVDDYRTVRIPTNVALRVKGIDATVLRDYIIAAIARRVGAFSSPRVDVSGGRTSTVARIRDWLARGDV